WTDCGTDGCPPGQADLQNTLTHESGHFYGLGHSDVNASTMAPGARIGETNKRDLEPDDVEGICAAYPPGSLTSACDHEPIDGLLLVCKADAGCGCSAVGVPGQDAAPFGMLAMLAGLVARRRLRRQ